MPTLRLLARDAPASAFECLHVSTRRIGCMRTCSCCVQEAGVIETHKQSSRLPYLHYPPHLLPLFDLLSYILLSLHFFFFFFSAVVSASSPSLVFFYILHPSFSFTSSLHHLLCLCFFLPPILSMLSFHLLTLHLPSLFGFSSSVSPLCLLLSIHLPCSIPSSSSSSLPSALLPPSLPSLPLPCS